MGPDGGPLEERFGKEREEILKFGYFDTRIEPSLGLGMLINATEWFQNEEIQLKVVQELKQAAFVKQARKLIQVSPYRSLLVVVHGFREAFPSALRKTAFISHVLDVDSPVLSPLPGAILIPPALLGVADCPNSVKTKSPQTCIFNPRL